MSSLIRNAVSKKKRRYQKNGFDLDLSYITDRVIAMGFPSESVEGVFRNPFKEVFRFLETYHKDHYRVYNLCSERGYDVTKFHNRVGLYPFDDHNAPPLELIYSFCKDVKEWMDADSKNVAVIHCKAGKGRTGLMICSYMLYGGEWKTAEEALNFYAAMRTYNQKGVTIPSQLRYVNYFGTLLQKDPTKSPPEVKHVILKTVAFQTVPKLANVSDIRFSVFMYKTLVYSSKDPPKINKSGHAEDSSESGDVLFEVSGCAPVRGDIKMDFYEKDTFGSDRLFAFWFHTSFINASTGTIEIPKMELDKANKDKSHKVYKENFKVILTFQHITALPSTGNGAQGAKDPNVNTNPADAIIEEQANVSLDQELSTGILNQRGKCKSASKRTAVEISQNLLKTILQIYIAYDVPKGKFSETSTIKKLQDVLQSTTFKEFVLQTAELQRVSLDELSHEDKLAFWINIFHTLRLHSNVLVTKFPANLVELLTYEKRVKYEISDSVVSLSDIEWGILRAKAEIPPTIGQLNLVSKFDQNDPRYAWALTHPEPRINFALNHGDINSPLLVVYQGSTIFDQLEKATRVCLSSKDNVNVDVTHKKIGISGILSLYFTDFGKTEAKAIKHLKEYFSTEQKQIYNPTFTVVGAQRDFSVFYNLKHFSVINNGTK